MEREKLLKSAALKGFDKVIDLTSWERQGKFLEGTGSLVLDRENRIAYACRSPRTHEEVVCDWAERMNYQYCLFDSFDEQGQPVYHTNVMMHVGTHLVMVCLASVKDAGQRRHLVQHLEQSGKMLIDLSFNQMCCFAGNMLELHNNDGEKMLIMSQTALHSLTSDQISMIEQDVRIVSPAINVIETIGGGSARCMLAELF